MTSNDTILFTDTLAPVNEVPACLKRLPKQKPVDVTELHADIFEDSTHITSILSGDTLYVDRGGAGMGVQGDPVPYNISNDNFITSLLLACFLLALFASAQSYRFIVRQAKNFFSVPRREFSDITETSNELHFQLFLALQTSLLVALLYFFYWHSGDTSVNFTDKYKEIGIYTGVVAVYFLVKLLLYWITGWVFFDNQKTVQWSKAYLFLISTEGVFLLPAVLLCAYFKNDPTDTLFYIIAVVGIVKLLTLYRTSVIFFRKKNAYLQNILYFCALEVVPLCILAGILLLISNYLRIIL
ncbi:MAG: DUF4271 domain-containing protein [Prevotella sp.]|jgi:hypothetical protein